MNYETSYGHSHTVAAVMASVYLCSTKVQRRQGYFFLEGSEGLTAQGGLGLLTIAAFTVICGKMEFRFVADGTGAYSISLFDKYLSTKGPLVVYYFNEAILSDISGTDSMLWVMKRLAAIGEKIDLGQDLVLPLRPAATVLAKNGEQLGNYPLGGSILTADFMEALATVVQKSKE